MTKTILAIDPSTTALGYAFSDGRLGTLTMAGARQVRLAKLLEGLQDLSTSCDVVAYYRPFARGADATRCGWGAVGVVEAVFGRQAAVLDVAEITVRAWHKFPAKLARADLKKFSVDLANKLGYHPVTHDEADAALLLHYVQEKIA